MDKISVEHPANKIVERIYNVGKKASTFVNQLLAFSRMQVLQMRVCSLNTIINNMKDIIIGLLGSGIKLEIHTDSKIKNILADESQLEHALINLVVNAGDAMPKGGTLTIRTESAYFDGKSDIEHHGNIKGHYAVLSVKDTGIGMSKEVQDRIFEPFFTTKEKRKGTGLGLSTVFGVIKQHNGFIMVDSKEGKGTTFKIYLPITENKIEVTPTKEISAVEAGNETILVVEDDDAVRELIVEPKGYKAFSVVNSAEALRFLDTTSDKFDLLLTDVLMPGRNGWQLYNEVVKKIPNIKVIFISGYVNSPVILNNIKENKLPFINKPLIPNALLAAIRDVLDGRSD